MKIIAAVALMALCSCTSVNFAPYVGEQENWPTAKGTIVETVKGVPIYHGHPPKPYAVVGEITLERRNRLDATTEEKAAEECRKRACDAVLWLEKETQFGRLFRDGNGRYHQNRVTTAKAWLIRFVP